jgi:hypothetical protein
LPLPNAAVVEACFNEAGGVYQRRFLIIELLPDWRKILGHIGRRYMTCSTCLDSNDKDLTFDRSR